MRVKIENLMRYKYEEPVGFSPHLVRLFPRIDHAITMYHHEVVVNLEADIQYRRDLYDNLVAKCFLPKEGQLLELSVNLDLEISERNPFHFLLTQNATHLPIQYSSRERRMLAPFLEVSPEEAVDGRELWRPVDGWETVDALLSLTKALNQGIHYEVREEGEAFLPAETLQSRNGACRDIGLLAASMLRQAGIGCRLVSGFLCAYGDDEKNPWTENALHAWLEVFLSGAGWIGLDPTNGVFCDHHFIPAAVGIDMADIAPITGNYYGPVKSRFESELKVMVGA
jgi:transglutaminase-like putative cysteine protease